MIPCSCGQAYHSLRPVVLLNIFCLEGELSEGSGSLYHLLESKRHPHPPYWVWFSSLTISSGSDEGAGLIRVWVKFHCLWRRALRAEIPSSESVENWHIKWNQWATNLSHLLLQVWFYYGWNHWLQVGVRFSYFHQQEPPTLSQALKLVLEFKNQVQSPEAVERLVLWEFSFWNQVFWRENGKSTNTGGRRPTV